MDAVSARRSHDTSLGEGLPRQISTPRMQCSYNRINSHIFVAIANLQVTRHRLWFNQEMYEFTYLRYEYLVDLQPKYLKGTDQAPSCAAIFQLNSVMGLMRRRRGKRRMVVMVVVHSIFTFTHPFSSFSAKIHTIFRFSPFSPSSI